MDGDERTRELDIVSWPLALYLVWIGLSVSWSVDVHAAAIDLLAFYVPFTILAVSIARLPWQQSRVRILYAELVAMALVFAFVGFYQYETKTIFQNAKLNQSNIFDALFRVNSVFYDPSIYGRFLVVAMIATAVLVVRDSLSLRAGLAALAFLAVAWLGLLISFSQSSFAALLVAVFALDRRGLALEVAVRACRRPRRRGRRRGGAAEADARAAPSHGLGPQPRDERAGDPDRGRDQDRRAHPSHGVGLGGFEHAYSKREDKKPKRSASHNTPVTVAAEEGGPGLLIFFWLVGALLLAALRRINHRTYGLLALAPGSRCSRSSSTPSRTTTSSRIRTTWVLIGLSGSSRRSACRHARRDRWRPPTSPCLR